MLDDRPTASKTYSCNAGVRVVLGVKNGKVLFRRPRGKVIQSVYLTRWAKWVEANKSSMKVS